MDSLYTFFRNLPDKKDIDLICIVGDLFDTLLEFNSNDGVNITIWMNWLLEYCALNNIILRVLEGTPSHDWKQSIWFDTIIKFNHLPVNFKYVSDLSIEYIEELDIQVLYVPDEWNADNLVTYRQVVELLRDNNLSQVDMAFMHGQFDYQIPNHLAKIPRHDSNLYIPLVKYYISIGHVHIFSYYENIIAQGSFDRISHNEEDPKGAIEMILHKDGNKSFNFIENKNARIFKTLDIKSLDMDKIYTKINKALKTIPAQSFVRLRVPRKSPILANFKELTIKYSNIHWSHVLDDDSVVSQSLFIESVFTNYESISITKDNLIPLVEQKLTNYSNKQQLVDRLQSILIE